MIPDWDTNTVWISDQLPHRHPLLVPKLQAILRKHGIPLRTVAQTNDVWIRDYAPIQVSRTEFVKFRYEPDYLTAKFAHLITAKEVFDDIPFLKHRQDSRIILDGGNVVASRNRVILTEKVFTENPRRNRTSLMRKLGQILRAEITIIPREKFDRIGHADGMVRFLADDVVVVNDYSDIAPRLQAQLTKVLSKLGLQVETLSYFPENRTRKGISSAVGNYVNFLRVGNLIVLPAYGIPSDGQAKKQMKRICPDAKVISLFCKDLAREGGVLNCVTWTIRAGRQESSGGDPQRLVFLAENGQRIPLKSIKVKGPHVGIWWHSTSRLVAVLQPITSIAAAGRLADSDLAHADEWPFVAKHLHESPASEYSILPRGRTLYDRNQDRGIIYHGNGTDQERLKKLAGIFSLVNWEAKIDDHYLVEKAADELFKED